MAAFALRLLAVECQYAGAFLPVSSERPEGQLLGIGFAAGYDWDQAQSSLYRSPHQRLSRQRARNREYTY